MNKLYFQSTKKFIRITYFLTLVLLSFSLQGIAVWTQNGPEGGSFLIKENNGILYSTNAIGLYKSTDNGVNWNRVSLNSGFTMKDLVFTPNRMLAACNTGMRYSIDNGISWVSCNNGFQNADTSNGSGAYFIKKLDNGRLITSLSSGSYYSDNNGQSWTASSQALNNMVQTSSNLISCTDTSIITSSDNGVSWQTTNSNGILASDFSQLKNWFYYNNTLYAGGNGVLGLYSSTDNGLNWTLQNNGITGIPVSFLIFINNVFYQYAHPNGVYKFNISTNSWSLSNISPMGYNSGRYFSQSISFNGMAYSDNNGLTWQNSNGLNCMAVAKLSISENLYVLGVYDGGYIYDSTQTSFMLNTPYRFNFSANTSVQYFVYDIKKRSNGTIYLATAGGVWKSINNGTSYTQSYNGLPFSTALPTYNTYTVYDMFISGTFPNDTLFVGTTNGIYFSTDDAQTFTQIAATNGNLMQQFLKYQNILYCAGSKIFKLTTGNSWSQFSNFSSLGILGFAATDNHLFVAVNNSPIRYAHVNGLSNFANIASGTLGTSNAVAAYDTLVFFMSVNGVFKLNTGLLGSATPSDIIQIADNLPFYYSTGNFKKYSYLDAGVSTNKMAIFNGKLWLGTNGMSTFYRSLNDFGYSLTVGSKNKLKQEQGLVYPNPANDKIIIANFTNGTSIIVYNSIGQKQFEQAYNQNSLDISKLLKGFYNYSIIDKQQNIKESGKFVKE